MKATLVKRVNSRADVDALSEREKKQFMAAGLETVGAKTLEDVVKWSHRELLGWLVLRIEDANHTFDGWLLANGDDGVFFDHDATEPNGLAVSQTMVSDTTQERDALVAALQKALDDFELPPFTEWVRS